MKSFLYAMALGTILIPLAGCETLSETPGENWNRVVHTSVTDWREMPDDVERDVLFLDRPTWMSKEPVPDE